MTKSNPHEEYTQHQDNRFQGVDEREAARIRLKDATKMSNDEIEKVLDKQYPPKKKGEK